MPTGYFTPSLPATDEPFPKFFKNNFFEVVLKDSLHASTILAVGAAAQCVACAVLPLRWAFVPSAAILINVVANTVLQVRRFTSPPPHVIPGISAAVLPSPETGLHGPTPNKESFVVFHLGFQFNHPLGILAPGIKELGEKAEAIYADIEKNREEYGLLGLTHYKAAEKSTNSNNLVILYFKDVEGVHRFAHSEVHRRGWDAFKNSRLPYVGLYHETFIVERGGHEAVYQDCYPILLGRATVKAKTDDGEKYVGTLVDAKRDSRIRTQWARLHRDAKGQLKEDLSE